jgi:hypothetical protein
MHWYAAGIAITQGSTPTLQALILSQDSTWVNQVPVYQRLVTHVFFLWSNFFFNYSIVHFLHPPLHPDSRDSIAGRRHTLNVHTRPLGLSTSTRPLCPVAWLDVAPGGGLESATQIPTVYLLPGKVRVLGGATLNSHGGGLITVTEPRHRCFRYPGPCSWHRVAESLTGSWLAVMEGLSG